MLKDRLPSAVPEIVTHDQDAIVFFDSISSLINGGSVGNNTYIPNTDITC